MKSKKPLQRDKRSKEFTGRRVLIVGLGLHGGGASAVRWFVRHGAKVRVTDLKDEQALQPTLRRLRLPGVVWHLGGHQAADFRWAEIIYQNQGVPARLPELRQAAKRGAKIVNETSLFFERCPAMIIGVTGTRGKSTTTALLGEMVKSQWPQTVVSGNIRQTPMLDVLDRLRSDDRVLLELSSFQLEFLPAVRRSPAVAVMTNLKVDHLNRYPSLEAYGQAKLEIFRWQKKNDTAVLNYDNPWTRRAGQGIKSQVLWFSQHGRPPGHSVRLEKDHVVEYKDRRRTPVLHLRDFPLVGEHQRDNLLAAVSVARVLGIESKKIAVAVKNFHGLPSRQELVRRWRHHECINDTTATTPDGTLAALAVWPKALFIVGGTDKVLNFTALAKAFVAHRTTLVFLPGTATDQLRAALKKSGYHHRHEVAESMAAAVRHATRLARPGQAIVLSPGAASFGLFQHEFDRGDQFVRAVKKL